MCENRLIYPKDLELTHCSSESLQQDAPVVTLKEAREAAERSVLIQTLSDVKFNISLAAKQLGVSRVTLYNLLKKYNLQ